MFERLVELILRKFYHKSELNLEFLEFFSWIICFFTFFPVTYHTYLEGICVNLVCSCWHIFWKILFDLDKILKFWKLRWFGKWFFVEKFSLFWEQIAIWEDRYVLDLKFVGLLNQTKLLQIFDIGLKFGIVFFWIFFYQVLAFKLIPFLKKFVEGLIAENWNVLQDQMNWTVVVVCWRITCFGE